MTKCEDCNGVGILNEYGEHDDESVIKTVECERCDGFGEIRRIERVGVVDVYEREVDRGVPAYDYDIGESVVQDMLAPFKGERVLVTIEVIREVE